MIINPICVSDFSGFDCELVAFQQIDTYAGRKGSSSSVNYDSSWDTLSTNACAKLKSRKNRVITNVTIHLDGRNVILKGTVLEILGGV
jgi:hypothetical protein